MNYVERYPPPPAFKARQVYEQIADAIRSSIVSGLFPAGSRLPSERELAMRFGVSRPAVREAIGALQNEGHVMTRHGSGTYVNLLSRPADSNPDTAASAALKGDADISPTSILDVRMLIEPAIARLAARHKARDPQAEQYLQQMTNVHDICDPVQQAAWNIADSMFHRQLAVMTRDPLVVKIADEIASSMDQRLWQRLRDDGIYDAQRIQLYVAEHRLIYEAVVQGDGDAAAFYIEGHLKRVRADIATRD
jgi:DNA-binding FadR family transcriptional regulator